VNAAIRGVVALLVGVGGGFLCWFAGDLLARLHSGSWLIFLAAFGLVALAGAAFWFVSAQLEGLLDGRPNLAGGVHWLTLSSIGLVLAAFLGLIAGFAGPRGLPYVMAEDVGIALVVGLALWATGPVVGRAIYHVVRLIHPASADKWAPPRPHHVGRNPSHALLFRCLLVAFAGLFLSVGEQVVGTVGSPVTGNVANAYAPIGGWLLGTAIAWRLTTPLFPRPSHHPTRHIVHAGALTLIVSIAALFAFANSAAQSADRRLWNQKGAHNLAQAMTVPLGSPANYDALPAKFSPELRFRKDEPWYPTSVSWYLSQQTQKPPPKSRPNCPDGCYSLPCDDAKGACAVGGSSDSTVYVNVTHGSRWPDPVRPRVVGPDWVLLQYWFFYNYDSLRMPILTQWHQADWEQVSVALSVTGDMATPVYVGYSEHCAGVVVPWSRVEIGRGTTHPLVFVARGSHANYPRLVDSPIRQLNCSLGLKPPRYLGVGGLFFSSALHGDALEVPVGYVFGLRDRTGNNVGPSHTYALRPLKPNDEIEGFRGNWGRDNNLKLWLRPARGGGAGPRSPPDQSAWKGPGQNMLCSTRWFSPRPHPKCKLRLPPVEKE
jgi:hypothetical protein